ncbi:hypothetical protein [Ammoniphilus sp. YIM 78166]|uniref:hypothetical protein n=1 Tax=Ammoniphilus sp. YIM 78166 TaxID=1644106 RepID=UPI00106F8A7A|nr:hypothetical protein [Ammoniphilus sp. YIM 78166]
MRNENMIRDISRVMTDLDEMLKIAQADYSLDPNRYHIGIMVGIGYAKKELDKIIEQGSETHEVLALTAKMNSDRVR